MNDASTSGTPERVRFSEAELRFFQQLAGLGYEPSTIFDIGASNGLWSKVTRPFFPRAAYHLFEPLADAQAHYRERLEPTLKDNPNFTLHKIGLGDKNSDQKMAIYTKGFGSTFLEIARIAKRKAEMQASGRLEDIAEFPVRRLDDYVREQHLPDPQIIKMDVQGFESRIIAGGEKTVRKADMLLLETWLHRGYGATTPLLHEIQEQVEALGFILTDFGGAFFNGPHQLISVDAFFMRKDFAEAAQEKGWTWTVWR